MGDRGHSVDCADAVRTTPEQCKCRCGGDFHGGPHSERVRALVWAQDNRQKYSQSQVGRAKRSAREALDAGNSVGEACTDFAVTHVVNELIFLTSAEEQQVAREVLKALIEPFVEKVASAPLDDDDATRIVTAVNNLHLLCSLCVEILKVIDQLHDLADDAAAAMAQTISESVIDSFDAELFLTDPVKDVLKAALARSFHAAIDLVVDPVKVQMLRLVGFAMCPNVAEHADVEKYCVAPLGREWVTSVLHNWMTSGFPADSPILKRAPRRKKPA